jgi:hypothetical protein
VLAPREWWFLVALAAPFVAVVFVLRPAQGMFRDFDDFVTGGVGLALLLAVLVAQALRSLPRAPWLAVAVTLCGAVPALQWLAHQADLERGIARVEALAVGPPLRPAAERAKTWDYLGIRRHRTGNHQEAERYMREAVALAPSPRIVLGWAFAAAQVRDWDTAERANRLLLVRTPRERGYESYLLSAYTGLAVAFACRDSLAAADLYADSALRVNPRQPMAAGIRRFVAEERVRRLRGETTHVQINPVAPDQRWK